MFRRPKRRRRRRVSCRFCKWRDRRESAPTSFASAVEKIVPLLLLTLSLFNASFRLMAEEIKSDAVLTNAVVMTSVCLVTKQTDRRMTLLKLFYKMIICALIFQVRQLRITFHIFISCLFIEGLFSTCVP